MSSGRYQNFILTVIAISSLVSAALSGLVLYVIFEGRVLATDIWRELSSGDSSLFSSQQDEETRKILEEMKRAMPVDSVDEEPADSEKE